MIEKAFLAFVGLVALCTAVSAAVFAAAYALFEVLRGPVGPAGAAALVALTIALLIGLGVLSISMARHRPAKVEEDHSPLATAMKLAREKPMIATGALIAAGLAAGLVAARNPKVVMMAVSAFLAGRSQKKT